MSRKAYLALTVDTESLAVTRVGIYSSHARNLTCRLGKELYVNVMECEGEDYSEARDNVIKAMEMGYIFRPLLPHLEG